ncbi:hypothetical protein AgCh_005244 [Apium graveolens]
MIITVHVDSPMLIVDGGEILRVWRQGFGYEASNPLHLRSVLEDKRYSKSQIVLLHASYPFSKEASYLASIYSQAVPKLSVHGMITSVKELLELSSIKKGTRLLPFSFADPDKSSILMEIHTDYTSGLGIDCFVQDEILVLS